MSAVAQAAWFSGVWSSRPSGRKQLVNFTKSFPADSAVFLDRSLYASGQLELPEKTLYNKKTNRKPVKKTGGVRVDIRVGDILELKKTHPCGSRQWQVLRVGMDFKLRCTGCGHELMLPRSKAEKNIKKIIRTKETDT